MLKNLRISNIKALKDAQLLNLGRINVICGKNNSGKSTLLEGINDLEKRSIGGELSSSDIDLIHSGSVHHSSTWRNHRESFESLMAAYKPVIEEVAQTQSLWFGSDAIRFASEVAEKFDNLKGISGFPVDRNQLARQFQELFTDKISTILLPPKRNLELDVQIHTSQNAMPSGIGVLNYIFYAKNQSENSSEHDMYEQISEAFTEISSGYRFGVFPDQSNHLHLNFAYKDQPWIKSQDCGLGLQDLMVILFFAVNPHYQVILIEEPESHLHPDMQRRLFYFLREGTDKQFFVTTHSNVFLNNTLVDRVFFTTFEESVNVDDATSRASILDDLGYAVTDNLVSDLIVLVEGPLDTPIVEEFLKKLELDAAYNIKIWPLGGDIMDQLDLSVFAQNYSILAVIDQDPSSDKVRRKFESKCKELGIPITRLKRYSIENYFTLRALREVFGSQIPLSIIEIDPDKKLENQIGLDVKRNNRRLAKNMVLDEIKGTDLYGFFELINQKCKDMKRT